MTDFERKPEKAENEQASQGDPLLELTRLFASRAQSRQKGAEVTQERDNDQASDEGWAPALSARPTGISMTGSVLMGDYGTATAAPTLPDPVTEDEENLVEAASDWMDEVASYEEEAFPLPEGQNSLNEADYVDEQIFHALAGDLQAEDAESIILDESSPNTQPESLPQNANSQNSGFSGEYFGYGQSVQIDLSTATRKSAPLSLSPSPPSPPDNLRPRQPAPVAPPPPVPEPLDSFADFPTSDPAQAFAETLHDFDLTIQRDKRRRRSRPAPISTPLEVTEAFELPPVHHDSVPPLPIENGFGDDFSGTLAAEQNFFALPPEQAAQNKRFIPPEDIDPRKAESPLYDWGMPVGEETVREVPRPAPRKKRFAVFLLILLLGAMGAGGYWLYDFYEMANGEPVLIKASPGIIKSKPETNMGGESQTQDMAVYDQDSANPLLSSQATLLDGSEPPVNLDLLEEGAATIGDEVTPSQAASFIPDVNRNALDPVDASILSATERAIPVHIVPTVAIKPDEQGNAADIPSSQEADEVFVPAGDYRSQILQQIEQNGGVNPSVMRGEQNLSTESENRLPEDVSEPTSSPIYPEMVDVPLPNETPLSSPETAAGQSSSSSEGAVTETEISLLANVAAVDDDSLPSISNPPALIPSKPEPSERVASADSPSPVRQQAEIVSSDTVVDERFYVQISSQPSRDAAIESVADVKRRFASLIGNNQVVIVPADIPGRGIYYRVRILVSENSDAVTLCDSYQAAGGNCFVGR